MGERHHKEARRLARELLGVSKASQRENRDFEQLARTRRAALEAELEATFQSSRRAERQTLAWLALGVIAAVFLAACVAVAW